MSASDPEQLTCADCGRAFTLPAAVRERYPQWRPARCRSCHQRGRGASGAAVEQLRTLDEVLAAFHGGPDDGVFTDGSCIPNPGPGGWGVVWVRSGEIVDQRHGHDPDTTNNRMELTALIAAYDLVPAGTPVTIYTDSRLIIDTVTKWAPGWAKRGWRRKSGEVQNLDLVKVAYAHASSRPEVGLEWIKAHSGARWNEYADALASAWARERL